jgi:hypothetical protein
MNKVATIIAACLINSATCIAENGITITQERFQPGSRFPDNATQFVTVHNGTNSKVFVRVVCGFIRDRQLVGVGNGWANNLEAGQNGYLEITTDIEGPPPDHAECRVDKLDVAK